MRRASLALLLLALVGACGAQAAPPRVVDVTLKGTCTAKNTDDVNGVVISSTLTCLAKGPCVCEGASELLYSSATVSPGNGSLGHEKGTLVASGAHSTVTLSLLGTRTGVGLSKGDWTLGAVSGRTSTGLEKRGVYSSQTTELVAILGTTGWTVRISAAIGCWTCAPES
jgi:hypothetical protein